jgi:ketopantoate reductase|tara:strand:- start:1219 stop:1524 length:306 start_codon:yes stop_codon:yes gene_type:complete
MSMPKGHKSMHGYATVTCEYSGMDYRQIAEKMSKDGFTMNHATARNVFLRAMKKLAAPFCMQNGIQADKALEKIVRDPRFQEGMIEIMSNIYENENILRRD